MKSFITEDFLLHTQTARTLYHSYAKDMSIVDYHCHISPEDIARDHRYENITQLTLGGDHYKWRQIRSNGIDEHYITGAASDYEKFLTWARTLTKAIGNPLYHWMHLELKKYFGYDGILNEDTAEEVWELCNKKLQEPEMSVRGIISQSNVKIICTTDDPLDTLEYHAQLAADKTFPTKVFPTWRPDKCLNIDKPEFAEYVKALGKITGLDIADYASLTAALIKRLDHFNAHGCKASDHAIHNMAYSPADENTFNGILAKVLSGETPSPVETDQYKTVLMEFLAREYNKRGWAMQLHMGVLYSANSRRLKQLGPNTGFDCMANPVNIKGLVGFFDSLEKTDELPRIILFSAFPTDDAAIGCLLGCFQGTAAEGKLQQGPAWWFNDTKTGMMEQIVSLANLSLLGNFIGMLTDSRSFLSYQRHDYFRRILCDVIGSWVENGEYPLDMPVLGKMVQDICYNNAVKYFNYAV